MAEAKAELLKRSHLQPGPELSSKVDRWGDNEDFDSNFFSRDHSCTPKIRSLLHAKISSCFHVLVPLPLLFFSCGGGVRGELLEKFHYLLLALAQPRQSSLNDWILQPGAELLDKVDRWGDNEDFDSNFFFLEIALACQKCVLPFMFLFLPLLFFYLLGLQIPSVTNDAFATLLQYMYTANLALTCQNIGEVYTAARKLGMDGALELSVQILTGKSRHDVHSVYTYVTARKLGLPDAASRSLKTMTKRFEQIVGTTEYLDLTFDQVMDYLKSDSMATRR
ncbi:BACK domain-containing protein [Caerostris extrusa]|uniref:BACK domain-containing protein n=1 Tax=Caerostris extrusa TaxID=172846 RepID=A0AAV4S605_CAEEX|nr:BACK domain-containing protein [Caerostris extrusa]